jgi:hypothetical protein
MRNRVLSVIGIYAAPVFGAAALITSQITPIFADQSCLTRPSARMPSEGHWYYYRRNDRKCWFLRQGGISAPGGVSETDQPTGPVADTEPPSLLSRLVSSFSPEVQAPSAKAELPKTASPDGPRRETGYIARPKPKLLARREQTSATPPHRRVSNQNKVADEPTKNALFQDFLRWRERQTSLEDRTEHDTLFREFLIWNEQTQAQDRRDGE